MNKQVLTPWLMALVAVFGGYAVAQEENATTESGLDVVESQSLDDLLEIIRERRLVESEEHRERERQFSQSRDRQAELLRQAENEEQSERNRGERLNTRYENNETEIRNQQEILDERLGSLRELFGVLQQVAGDTRGVFEGSIVSVEKPGRGQFLGDLAAKMGTASQLASIHEMEELWILLQEQMHETGKVSRFDAEIELNSGEKQTQSIIRVGDYNLVSQDGYINYDINVGVVRELARQPASEFEGSAGDLYEAGSGEQVAFGIDPTRGGVLSLEVQKATLGDMVGGPLDITKCGLPFCAGQGGTVGSIIIMVGIIGVLLAIERLISLTLMGAAVKKQKGDAGNPSESNPLGRIINVYQLNKTVDTETLQLKMGEAVLQEMPKITRNISVIQVISVVAPLMGLLGTVIGMIQTFQAITLYGTGDPKIMASGISTALMTTVLGLCVAIPTVLLHALVNQQSLGVIHVLDEQSEGIIAGHAEEAGQPIEGAS